MPNTPEDKSNALDKIPLPAREYKPVAPPTQSRSSASVLMVVGTILLVAVVLIIWWVSEMSQSETLGMMPQVDCLVTANTDANIRIGPGLEYRRAWILNEGESRRATYRVGFEWFQIDNGWLPRSAVSLKNACNDLPESQHPKLFEDDIELPKALLAAGWGETLGENFATNANGWVKLAADEEARLVEGELILAPDVEIAPTRDNILSYEDAYYTFEGYWEDATLVFIFRRSEIGEYQLHIESEKVYLRTFPDPKKIAEFPIAPIVPKERFLIGILSDGSTLEIFLNNQTLVSIKDETLSEGRYAFKAQGGEVHLRRFEVNVPLP